MKKSDIPDTKYLTATVPAELFNRIDRVAKEDNRSRSNMVVLLLTTGLAAWTKKR